MTSFAKLAPDPSGPDLLDQARCAEAHRMDGEPFALLVTVADEARLLIVHEAGSQSFSKSGILTAEGVRAAAKRLIREHQQRLAMSKPDEADGRTFG